MIKEVNTTLERVNQSQLGMYIHLSTGGDPLKVTKLSDLAKDEINYLISLVPKKILKGVLPY